MGTTLSAADVQRLMTDPSAETRTETAAKVASSFQDGSLGEVEQKLASEIFRVLAKDAEERVRQALSQNLKNAAGVPSDVAVTLAKDISDKVALPIIQFSEALTEDDLIDIVRTQAPQRQVAVASREDVTDGVAHVLVDEADKTAVVALVSNERVNLSEGVLDKVVETYGEDEDVQRPLVHRPTLPITITEKLVTKLTDELKDYLVQHHELSEETATDLILQARERATIGLAATYNDETDVEALVRQLHNNGRLTPSIVFRSLCVGDLVFFENALAIMADVPLQNARILIHDEGDLGFKSLYAKGGLPSGLLPAFRTGVSLARDNEKERTDADLEQQTRSMLEHVLTAHEDVIGQYGEENVDYLLNKFNQVA
ncbi:DUF2336 domain-containing protein [Curvivirga sp.]|uniref:DUF2336 domain-containing protein n=1 Tax=Curvivirga sp. TaxID=2856848 RepID=UPI003B5AE7C0